MIFALLFGGLIGAAFRGFTGFIIGAAIAYGLVKLAKHKLLGKIAQVQQDFVETTFAVMGALCKADGVVTQDEIAAAEAVFVRFRFNPQQKEQAIAAFNRGKQPDFDLDAELRRFVNVSRGQPALMQMFLQIQISAIAADGQIHQAEHQMLLKVARGLGLPEQVVEQISATLRGSGRAGASQQATQRDRLADAYRVLGVDSNASDKELKRAYRKLMSENHPDKLAGRGLPESMREMAEEKTREISSAYDVIKTARQG